MEREELCRPGGRKMKITRVSIVDQVCSSIKQDIADGIWKAGDKLPSEAEFAETFGVNRLSVRMAL
ncbi:MAG: FadR/GntR family transcriptional regulator [Lachnospirales bacterium]